MIRKLSLPLSACAALFTCFTQASNLRAEVFERVAEARDEGYEVLYELDLPATGGFHNSTPVPYETDNSKTVSDFDRVAYYLELNGGSRWIYVSMDVFSQNPRELGLPHNRDNPVIHQRTVENLNVFSNVSGIVTGTFLDGGNVEMWPNNYRSRDDYGIFAANDDAYDWGDGPRNAENGPSAGYGSFQVHNALARQTLLAFNGFGTSGSGTNDIGIGNSSSGNPDWTFAENAGSYSQRRLVVLVRPRMYDLSFTDLPKNYQLYPRDPETNLATVRIAGTESSGGYDQIQLRIRRNGQLHREFSQPLDRNRRTSFSFETEIPAELAGYDFDLFLERDGNRIPVRRIRDVVAGDVFLFYGQSNAEARRYGSQSANSYSSRWLRTFGQNGDFGGDAENILFWVEAEGDGGAEDPGSIGQWAMVLGRNLIDTHQVPIAILNGSRGGYSIRRLQKDRSQPDNLYDDGDTRRPYNRLRHRAIQAGVAETARAMFFYQGEGDNDGAERHAEGFAQLRADWANDFPGIEQFYIVQVRPGCSVSQNDVRLRDVQRRFADQYPNTSVMATNGLTGHDGCHYNFVGGYEDLGWHHFRQVSRDLYGGPNHPDIDALNPLFAEFTDETRTAIRLILRNHSATIHFPNAALNDFVLNGSRGLITGRTVENNAVVLQLSQPAPSNSTLEYRANDGSGAWVTNGYGIGMLSFAEPVMPFHFLGLPNGAKESFWLGRMNDGRFDRTENIGWLLHEEHKWLYTAWQENLAGVWLWDDIQQDWFWTKASVYPLLYRHNNGNGYWLYYEKGGTPDERVFYDYRRDKWITVP